MFPAGSKGNFEKKWVMLLLDFLSEYIISYDRIRDDITPKNIDGAKLIFLDENNMFRN